MCATDFDKIVHIKDNERRKEVGDLIAEAMVGSAHADKGRIITV